MMKNKPLRKQLKEYYSSYYNDNFLRDFRYLLDKPSKYYSKKDNQEKESRGDFLHEWKYKSDTSRRQALAFLTLPRHNGNHGLLGGQIAYFKTLDDYHEGDIEKKYCDRLFFDFDIEDERVSKIKTQFKDVNENIDDTNERNKKLKSLKADFRNLIFEDDILSPTFDEARKLCLFMEDLGLKPYLIFSGSKGFHINVFFDERQLSNFSQISKRLALSFSKKLDLKYLDYAVFDKARVHNRLQRCQYAYHSSTNLLTLPIPYIYDYDEALSIIEKNKRRPIEFNFQDWKSSEDFSQSLTQMNNDFEVFNARRQRELEFENKKRIQKLKKKFGANYKPFEELSMEDICQAYGIDGKHQGDRIIVSCPFHNDKNPSAVIFKNSNYFHCSTCNLTLNYWSFIAEMEGLSSDDKCAIVEKLNEIRG